MRLGIVGGMGSPAGAWLFSHILAYAKAERDQDYPEILLHNNSRIPDRTEAILYGGKSPIPELARSIHIFNSSGMDIAVLACMTAYYYHRQLAAIFRGRLVDPVELVLRKILDARGPGIKRVGLMGTSGLIRSNIFPDRFGPAGLEIITLDEDDQQKYFMTPIYMPSGIKSGINTPEIRDLFWTQSQILTAKGADVLVGACSEIPLVLDRTFDRPFFNVFDLLAKELASMTITKNQKYNARTI
jgi:aspartate racemase